MEQAGKRAFGERESSWGRMRNRLLRFVRRLLYLVLGLVLLLFVVLMTTATGIFLTERGEVQAGAQGRFVEVKGRQLHVRLFGDPETDPQEPPLLLIHGFSVVGGHEYDRIIPELEGRRSLIVPDLLGFGGSERLPQTDPHYDRAGQALLLSALLQRLDVEKVDAVGASYGGGVALQLALQRPDLVRRMALIDAQVEEMRSETYKKLCRLPFGLNRAVMWNYKGSSPLATWIASSGCGQVGYCPGEAELDLRWRFASVEGTTEALVAFCKSQNDPHIVEQLGEIEGPVLVMWGLSDDVLPERQREVLISRLEEPEQIVFPATGHAPHLERPRQVAQQLLDFFDQTARNADEEVGRR